MTKKKPLIKVKGNLISVLKKWWDETQKRMREDPEYLPLKVMPMDDVDIPVTQITEGSKEEPTTLEELKKLIAEDIVKEDGLDITAAELLESIEPSEEEKEE